MTDKAAGGGQSQMGAATCACGDIARPYTRAETRALERLRGRKLIMCPLCGHEVCAPRTAHDVRKMAATPAGKLAHLACVKVLAPDHGFNSERSQRAENGGRP